MQGDLPPTAGYGAVLTWKGRTEELSGGEQDTTNLRMEVTAQMQRVSKGGELGESDSPRQLRLTQCPRTHGHRQARACRRRGASAHSCSFRQPRRLALPARHTVHRPHAIRTTKTEGQGSGL